MPRPYLLHPAPRRSHRRTAGGRIPVLAILLAALLGWNLNAWLVPGTQSVTAPQKSYVTPDPWAVSREQRRLLEAQKGAPSPLVPDKQAYATAAPQDAMSARFTLCGSSSRFTCVVDGDTFWLEGEKIRVADIDTPEISSPRCEGELQRGLQARQRMQQLLNAGPFALEPADRAEDRYGRKLFRVTRGGESLGNALVGEGLAVWFGNGRPDWCQA